MSEIPRRIQLEKMVPAERLALDAIRAIEEMGCDERLSRAQMLIQQARDLVADVVDGVPKDPA